MKPFGTASLTPPPSCSCACAVSLFSPNSEIRTYLHELEKMRLSHHPAYHSSFMQFLEKFSWTCLCGKKRHTLFVVPELWLQTLSVLPTNHELPTHWKPEQLSYFLYLWSVVKPKISCCKFSDGWLTNTNLDCRRWIQIADRYTLGHRSNLPLPQSAAQNTYESTSHLKPACRGNLLCSA